MPGIVRKPGDPACQDQPPPSRRVRPAFARMAAVHQGRRRIEMAPEIPLVGLDHQRGRLNALRVRDHAVGGHDGEAFDAIGQGHAAGVSSHPHDTRAPVRTAACKCAAFKCKGAARA